MDMLISANRRHLLKFEPQVSKIIYRRNKTEIHAMNKCI